jgi:tetratricopeptide (TPR) repeat protein
LLEKHPREALPRVALAAHLLGDAREDEARRFPRLLEARVLLEEAVELNPASTEANMLLGDVLVELADALPAGEEDEENEENRLELAREAYGRALKRDPSDLATLLSLARLEIGEVNHSAAGVWLERAVNIEPEHFDAHWLLAGVREAQGNLEEATVHLWRARELDLARPPRVTAPEYRRRLIELYRRLAVRESSTP